MTIEMTPIVDVSDSPWRAQPSLHEATSTAPKGAGFAVGEVNTAVRRWMFGASSVRTNEHGGLKVSGIGPNQAIGSGISTTGMPSSAPSATSPTTSADQKPASELVTDLKKWTGVIQEIDDCLFTAELSPLDHEGPVLLADFQLKALAPDDANVDVGDIIYLTTRYVSGYDGHGRGYNTVTTQMRLRRIGRWSQEELRHIEGQAKQDAEEFDRYAE